MRHVLFVFTLTFFALTLVFSNVEGGQEESPSVMSPPAAEKAEENEFFDDLCLDESFPMWEHLVPAWRVNFQHRYRLWDGAGSAEFALSEDCQPDCQSVEISADVRQGEIVTEPLRTEDVMFKLTDNSLRLLEAYVPEEVLVLLARLKDRSFENEDLFTEALRGLIGEEELREFREVVLQHSYTTTVLNSPWLLAYLRETEEQSNLRLWRTWNDPWLFDGTPSRSIVRDSQNPNNSRRAGTSERAPRETWLFKLRAFCDKWGLPRPRTLLLLLLLFYLTASLIKNFVQARS